MWANRKLASATAVLALSALALVACSGGSSTEAAPRSSAARTTTSAATTSTTTSTTSTTVAAAPPAAYPSGSSVVAADCPVSIAPQRAGDTSGQDQTVAQTIVVHEYVVHGPSTADIRSQLDTCGPHDDAGARHDAYTKWYVSWTWGYDRSNGCSVTGVKAHVLIDMYLPRLDADPSSPVSSPWNAYTSALIGHENGHVQHGIDAANQAVAAVANLAPASTCDEMDALANQAGQQATQSFDQRDAEYDAETNHGATQGVVYP